MKQKFWVVGGALTAAILTATAVFFWFWNSSKIDLSDPNELAIQQLKDYVPNQQELDCFKTRSDVLQQWGSAYKELFEHVQSQKLRLSFVVHLAACRQGQPLSQLAAPWAWVGQSTFLHEMIHLAGLVGQAAQSFEKYGVKKTLKKLQAQTEKSGYPYATIRPGESRLSIVVIPRLGGLPMNREILPRIEALLPMMKKQEYIIDADKNPDQDFYHLIDEWNAYLVELERNLIDVLATGCPTGLTFVDHANSVIELELMIVEYLKMVQEKQADKFASLKSAKTWLLELDQRTQAAVGQLNETSCLLRQDRWQPFYPHWVQARRFFDTAWQP